MRIKYENIILRDMTESDIEDEIRWHTTETQWAQWDAPWETEEELARFDPEKHREEALAWLSRPKPAHRLSMEIETGDGVHIGNVSAYCIDENFEFKEFSAEERSALSEEARRGLRWAVGIEINESAYWSGGWGTQAMTAWLEYHIKEGYTRLYTQTWSGNVRMIGLAKKLGFVECGRKKGLRRVRGNIYDALTFCLER